MDEKAAQPKQKAAPAEDKSAPVQQPAAADQTQQPPPENLPPEDKPHKNGPITITRSPKGGLIIESNDPRALTDGAWCQAQHVGVVLSGRWGAELLDGTILEWGPDDVFDCPPGHDGYTVGEPLPPLPRRRFL